MAETPLLRDHSGECVHGVQTAHAADSRGVWLDELCPGGQEVTDSDILTMAADIIETNPEVGAVIDAARKSGG